MNSFPEPTPYQRHEWSTFMCLLWHSARVSLPSEPNPYQTQTTRPRSALQLALRDVRSTECMFYEVIQAVCDWLAGWGQSAGLFEVHSWPWHCCWVQWVTVKQQGQHTGHNMNGITTSSVAFYRRWNRLNLAAALACLSKLQTFIPSSVYVSATVSECKCQQGDACWMGVKCVREGAIIFQVSEVPRFHLNSCTCTQTLECHVSCYTLSLPISCHSVCLSLSTCLLSNVPDFSLLVSMSTFQPPCPLTCHSVLIV